ncbi:MAG: PAS domain S-box protein [Chloroflexi bacterium]|nr:PAS domain S-box protein [Chloroflexota bacterium]
MRDKEKVKRSPVSRSRAGRACSPKLRSGRGVSPSHDSSLGIQPGGVSLTGMLETLKPHDHSCLIYESREEWRAAVVPFIAIGLKYGEKCIYIVDTSTADEIRKYLGEEGIDVASAEKSGQLSILHQTEAYTKKGSFDPDRMIALLISETEKAIAEGYPALRVTGEMTWVLRGHPGSEKLLEYEAKLNSDFFPKYPCLAICQYDRWKFDPEIIKGIVMTHPLLIIKGKQVYHNFYYIPPQEFLNEKRAELEVTHWLNNLEREQRVQEMLRQSEEKYRTLTEQSLMGLVVLQDFRIVFANAAFAEIARYSIDELLSLPPEKVQALVHPEDQALVWGRFRDRLAGKTVPPRYEYRGIRKDRSVCWLEMHATRIEYGGKPAIQGAIIDITERKRAEEMLQESERKYHGLFDNANEAIYLIEPYTARIIDCNRKAAEMDGYGVEELKTMSAMDLHPPEERPQVLDKFRQIRKMGGVAGIMGLHHQRKDGTLIDIEANSAMLEIGGRMFNLSIVRDVTQRKRVEEALRQSEERYRTILEEMEDSYFEVDLAGNITFANDAASRALGYSKEELIGMNYRVFSHESNIEADFQTANKVYRTGEPAKGVPTVVVRKDGSIIFTERSVFPLRNENGEIIGFRGIARDITERKRAEEALRESEERYRSLVDNAAEGISVVQDAIIKFSNRKLTEITGYSIDEMSYMPTEKLIHPEDLDRVRKYHAQRMKGGKAPSSYSLRIVDKEGNVKWLERNVAAIIWEDKPAGLVFDTDITERKQIERLSSKLINSSPVGIYIIQGRKFNLVSPTFQKIVGYTENELLAMDPFNLVHPQDREMVRENAVKMLKGKRSSPYEYRYIRKSGEVRWVDEQVVSIGYQGDRATLGNFMDITERKVKEEEYQTIISTTIDGFWQADMQGHFLDVNEAYCQMSGYTRNELLNMAIMDVEAIEKPEETTSRIRKIKEVGYDRFESRHRRKDGRIIDVEISVNYLPVGNGRMIVFIRDITERKKVEEERKQLEQKAQIASRLASVGEMTAGVAHEINNPLTGVIGYAQLLMDRKDVPFDIRKDLAAINEGAQRVAGIVKRLLAFSRQTKPERRYVDINELIESTVALRDYHLKVNNVKVTIKLSPDVPETVADPGQIQQVLLNLIVNAETEMKLAHGRGKLTITTEKSDNIIKISVKDDGRGIKPEIKDRIFDPFFTTRGVGEGTGLGLSLCYGIIAEHKGKIYVESEPGKGATFIVELPVVTEAELPKPAEPVVDESEKVTKARILVVDDEQVVSDLVKRVLGGEGYEVDTADNAGDALKMIESQRYSLILLDIKMPGMDGAELYGRIQKMAKSLAQRVVFITGDIVGAATEKFLSETKVARIDKPFTADQLRREVKRALSGGR